ncbi:MAG: iron ABC transporter permease [Spirochaetia bacterium]|nr:iron ABC transporter permease [Spirochaetia bacterium]
MSNRRVWLLILILLTLLFLLPFAALLSGVFSSSDSWGHLSSTVLPRYIGSSLFLLLFFLFGVYSLGTVTAWIMTRYSFPMKPIFEVALIFPHAVPIYISAFAYRGLFNYGGLLHPLMPDFSGPWAAVFLFIFGLYTYVYLAARAMLATFGGQFIDTAIMLGKSEWALFRRVALPLMRPAAVGGAVLAGVEVLNEYGALKYLGVESFTTGIFRAWFSLGDITAAIRLSLLLLLTVGILLAAEKLQRGKAGFVSSGRNPSPVVPLKIRGVKGALITAVLLLPVTFGFFIPLLQLLLWTVDAPLLQQWTELAVITADTLVLTLSASFAAVSIALLLGFIPLLFNGGVTGSLASLPSLGYAVPGAVIAMGVMRLSISADLAINHLFNPLISPLRGEPLGLIFSGSLIVLAGAYLIRFIAVSFKPIASAYTSIGGVYVDSAATMGRGPVHSFFKIYLPLMKRASLFAGILFFLDAIRTLPLTMILRPFNYDTLATVTYELASDERLKEAAPFGLILVALGVGVTIITMMLSKGKRKVIQGA